MSNVIDGNFDQTASLEELDWDENVLIRRGDLIELCSITFAMMEEYMEHLQEEGIYEGFQNTLNIAEKAYLPEGAEKIYP